MQNAVTALESLVSSVYDSDKENSDPSASSTPAKKHVRVKKPKKRKKTAGRKRKACHIDEQKDCEADEPPVAYTGLPSLRRTAKRMREAGARSMTVKVPDGIKGDDGTDMIVVPFNGRWAERGEGVAVKRGKDIAAKLSRLPGAVVTKSVLRDFGFGSKIAAAVVESL